MIRGIEKKEKETIPFKKGHCFLYSTPSTLRTVFQLSIHLSLSNMNAFDVCMCNQACSMLLGAMMVMNASTRWKFMSQNVGNGDLSHPWSAREGKRLNIVFAFETTPWATVRRLLVEYYFALSEFSADDITVSCNFMKHFIVNVTSLAHQKWGILILKM